IRLVPLLVRIALGFFLLAEVSVGNLERSTETKDALYFRFVNAGKIRARILHIELARAHCGIDWLRLEETDEIPEVAAISGSEVPSIIVGKVKWLLLIWIRSPRRG